MAQPKADWGQTWPSLASSWDEQELTCAQLWAFKLGHRGQLAPTWAQLEPNWGPTWRNLGMFGRKLGLACATWSCVGASGAEVGPKTSPLWAKNIGNSSKNACFQCVALSPQNWLGLGTTTPRLQPEPKWCCLGPNWSHVGLKLEAIQMDSKLKPSEHGKSKSIPAAMLDRSGPFGQFWVDLQNVQTTTFAAKLPRLGTWGVGGYFP